MTFPYSPVLLLFFHLCTLTIHSSRSYSPTPFPQRLPRLPGNVAFTRPGGTMSLRKAVVLLVLCLACSSATRSQQQVFDGNNDLPPFGSFHGSDFDKINLTNGDLHISIPILQVSQRGKPVWFRYVYDTQTFQ